MKPKMRFPGRRDEEPQLQLLQVEPERTPMPVDRQLPNEETVDALREARRAGQYFQARKYRTHLLALVREWRERNTPEFYVAATELENMLVALRSDDPAQEQ